MCISLRTFPTRHLFVVLMMMKSRDEIKRRIRRLLHTFSRSSVRLAQFTFPIRCYDGGTTPEGCLLARKGTILAPLSCQEKQHDSELQNNMQGSQVVGGDVHWWNDLPRVLVGGE